MIVGVDCQTLGTLELPDSFTVFAPLINELPARVELLDSVKVPVLRNVEVAFGVLHDVGDETKLAGTTTVDSADRQLGKHFAFGGVKQDAKIMRVANHQLIVLADLKPTRLSRIALGSSPVSYTHLTLPTIYSV